MPASRVDDLRRAGVGGITLDDRLRLQFTQAAAVVAGAAALLIDQRPELSPDQVKDLLRTTASPVEGADAVAQGKAPG